MIRYTPCKVNLGLSIVGKRSDGFHDIRSLLLPVPVSDVLEMVPAERPGINLMTGGLDTGCNPAENLVTRAWQYLHDMHAIPGVDAFLFKRIPAGAGLGGGSSDGAAALSLLNDMFGLGMTNDVLREHAAELGSDCAFFIEPSPSLVSGRGEQVNPIQQDFSGLHLRILWPGFSVSTAEAYNEISDFGPELCYDMISDLDRATWQDRFPNAFGEIIFQKHPVIRTLRDSLVESGAWYASLSGSGSAVFGLFSQKPSKLQPAPPIQCFDIEL